MRHGERFYSLARDAELFGLHQRRSGAAKRVQEQVGRPEAEPLGIGTDEMRRIGEDEPVPPMRGGIFGTETVHGPVRLRGEGPTGVFREQLPSGHGQEKRLARTTP